VLEKTNAELTQAKVQLAEYARGLEYKVQERTAELKEAQQKLLELNRSLESQVKAQVVEIKRYDELRRYLSPKLTERILTSGQPLGDESHRKMMTVVFSDIRGFSEVTDDLEPEEICHLLNRYVSEMTLVVHRHDGTLNKMMGDGLLIFFGDPIPMEDHARRAVLMAIDMQNKVEALRKEWEAFGHDLGVGIGINTGFMTVGNFGSEVHRDYTVIGNQVNVASRLESQAGPGQILISQRTYSFVKDLVDVDELREIKVKGIRMPIKAYALKVP
jgi:class 3 adenylate cyclase